MSELRNQLRAADPELSARHTPAPANPTSFTDVRARAHAADLRAAKTRTWVAGGVAAAVAAVIAGGAVLIADPDVDVLNTATGDVQTEFSPGSGGPDSAADSVNETQAESGDTIEKDMDTSDLSAPTEIKRTPATKAGNAGVTSYTETKLGPFELGEPYTPAMIAMGVHDDLRYSSLGACQSISANSWEVSSNASGMTRKISIVSRDGEVPPLETTLPITIGDDESALFKAYDGRLKGPVDQTEFARVYEVPLEASVSASVWVEQDTDRIVTIELIDDSAGTEAECTE